MAENFSNFQLMYLEDALNAGTITPQDYLSRIELAYRANPTSFNEDEVDYIEKQFKKVDIKFDRDLVAGEANITSTVNQFVSGLVEGFTTLGWSEEPDTTVESISNKLGHLIGFAPDVIASFFSMGTYLPAATAKRIGKVGAGLTQAGLKKAADKAPSLFRKEVAPKTFMLQSIPMKVADKVTEQIKGTLGGATLDAGGFLSKGIFANKKFRNIGEQGLHLGVALGVSAWKEGPKGMVDAAMHGAAAGAIFGTIGNYVNVSRLIENPKTRKEGLRIVNGVAKEIADDTAKLEGVDMLVKGALGAGFQGGMTTMQGAPVAEQVYEYLLGAFFGATARSVGFVERQRWIMKNDPNLYELGKPTERIFKDIEKDPEFVALDKSDQQYIKDHIALVQQQKFDQFAPIIGNILPEFAKIAKEKGYNLSALTQKQYEDTIQTYKNENAAAGVQGADNTVLKKAEIKEDISVERDAGGKPQRATIKGLPGEEKVSYKKQAANEQIDVTIAQMTEALNTRDLNEPPGLFKNKDIEIVADKLRGYKIGKNNDEIIINLNKLAEESKYDFNKFVAAITKEYELDGTRFFTEQDGGPTINRERLGTYLKLKKHYDNRQDLEIDLSTDNVRIEIMPIQDEKGHALGGERPKNKWNATFGQEGQPKPRLIIRKSYVEGKLEKFGVKGEEKRQVFKRHNPLDYDIGSFKDYLNNEILLDIRQALKKRGAYVFGGAKDTGQLLIHRFPITELPGEVNTFNRAEQILLIKDVFGKDKTADGKHFGIDLKKLKLKPKTAEEINAVDKTKEIVSNMYYALVEAGYLNPSIQLTPKTFREAYDKYLNDPLFASVQKFNKYNNLAQGADVPLESIDYVNTLKKDSKLQDADGNLIDKPEYTQEGMFNVMMMQTDKAVKPGFQFVVGGEASISGTDSVVYYRQDIYDITQTKNFRPARNGFLKMVGWVGPRDGAGNILMKTGTFRATDAMNKFMIANDIHIIGTDSAMKTQLGLKKHILSYEPNGDTWTNVGKIEPFRVKPEEMYINLGVYENDAKLNGNLPILKQIFDKINKGQLGKDGERFIEDYNQLIEDSIQGVESVNKEFISARDNKRKEYEIKDIDDLSLDIIEETIDMGANTTFGKKMIKALMERGQQDYHRLLEESNDTNIDRNIYGIETYQIADILNKVEYEPTALLSQPMLSYINRTLLKYRTGRLVKPNTKFGASAKLGPRDAEIETKFKGKLRDDTFLLSEDFGRDFIVNVRLPETEGGGRGTLKDVYDIYLDTKANPNKYTTEQKFAFKEALDFLIVRSPNSGNGGVRVLQFNGFVKRKGYAIITTSKNDYMLGGADKDADSVNIYQNMNRGIKDVFKKYTNELTNEKGETYSFEKPSGIFADLVKEYQPKDKAEAMRDLFDPGVRTNVARMARRGKQNIGFVVDGSVRMQNILDLLQQNGGELTTRQANDLQTNPIIIRLKQNYPGRGTLNSEQMARQLQRDTYQIINLMADSSNFTSMAYADAILNRMWTTYFDVLGSGTHYKGGKIKNTNFKDFNESMEHVKAFKVLQELHSVIYKGKSSGQLDPMYYTEIAKNYIDVWGESNPYYYKLAKGVLDNPNFVINPFIFYGNEIINKNLELSNFGIYEATGMYVKRLRDLVANHKLFKDFGLLDTYNSDIETKLSLKLIIDNPTLMHNKLMEYQGMWRSLRLSDYFIQSMGVREDVPYTSESAQQIVKEVIRNTYNIKSFMQENSGLALNTVVGGKRNAQPKDINQYIANMKLEYQQKYPEIFTEIEAVIDSWLLTKTAMVEPSKTKFQYKQQLDLFAEGKALDKEIFFYLKNGNEKDLASAIAKKNAAFNKYVPDAHFLVKSIAINNKNRLQFYRDATRMLQENLQTITSKLQLNESQLQLRDYQKVTGEYLSIETIKENPYFKQPKEGEPSKKKQPTEKKGVEKNTPQTRDIIENTERQLFEILPQFDWTLSETKPNRVITEAADREIKRTKEILRSNPSAIERFEELFIDLTFRSEGIGRRLELLTTKDLKMLNDALVDRFSARSILDKATGELKRKPGWIEQTLNYEVVGRSLEQFDRVEYEQRAIPILDKYGQEKPKTMNVILPTSSLEQIRLNIDRFDQLTRIQQNSIEKKHTGKWSWLSVNDANLNKHVDLLVEAAWNSVEYNGGKYPTGETGKLSRQHIKEAYFDSVAQVEKLGDTKFPVPANLIPGEKGGKGVTKYLTAKDTIKIIKESMIEGNKDIYDFYISSRWDRMAESLRDMKAPGLKVTTLKDGSIVIVGDYKPSVRLKKGQKGFEEQQLEMLLLDKNGVIREDRIALLFRDIERRNITGREITGKQLPSMNDYRFIKYHLEIKNRAAFQYPKIDLMKPLTKKSEIELIQNFVKSETQKAGYSKHFVGNVREGYMPRLGHTLIKKNIPLVEQFIKDRVEQQIERARNNPEALPLKFRMMQIYEKKTLAETLDLYREALLGKFERSTQYEATSGMVESERQILDLLTRPNTDGFVGDYAASMTKSRADEFVPFYKKDLDALRMYQSGFFKAYLTNLAGLRTELILRNFDYRNKGEKFVKNWSNYMRNAAVNMMGMSSYRALNIHGIQEKDQALFKRYIKNGLKREGMRVSNDEKELLQDFDAAIQVNATEQQHILYKHSGKLVSDTATFNYDAAIKEANALRMSRAKQLVTEVNTTGKYGTLYHYTSDEVAVKFFTKLDNLFGGRLFGKLPETPNERRHAILKRVKAISDLEGKFELLSLLSHPKTAITNLYGGTVNTISDTGWQSFRRANNTEWMKENIFKDATFKVVDEATGEIKTHSFESRKEIDMWLESIGVYDQMFLDMVSLDRNFGRRGLREFWKEYIRRVNKGVREREIQTKEKYEQLERRTLLEVAKDLKIDVPIVEFGALPMKWSERKLRGTAFLANYINMHQNVLGKQMSDLMPFDSAVFIDYGVKGVLSSQFMYQATFRPNFANTSMGRVLTRFQPYAWNSIGRRMKLFKGARQAQWNADVQASKKFQRQFTFDLMSLALANIFVASLFEYALSPPMSWMQDTAQLMFGDKKERERAFFSSYPHPALAPLQVVTPPIGRFVLSPLSSILNNDFEAFTQYQLATYFPFGRLYRDIKKTYNSPAMAVDFMTGMPLHQVHTMRRDQIEKDKSIDEQLEAITGDVDPELG